MRTLLSDTMLGSRTANAVCAGLDLLFSRDPGKELMPQVAGNLGKSLAIAEAIAEVIPAETGSIAAQLT